MTGDEAASRDRPGGTRSTRGRGALRIGLTGPIGCGKSTVAGWLAARGAVAIDADAVARAVVEPGEPALARVLERFGSEVTAPDGSLDRAALGRIVFADPAALLDLEAIIHPAVRPRVTAAIAAAEAAGASAIVVEAIRLVDGGLLALCDEVWLIECSPASQRARLLGRGAALDDADRRIAAQAGQWREVRRRATRIVSSDGPTGPVRETVEAMLADALAQAGGPPDRPG
jgi:dephospho-CoA kinase